GQRRSGHAAGRQQPVRHSDPELDPQLWPRVREQLRRAGLEPGDAVNPAVLNRVGLGRVLGRSGRLGEPDDQRPPDRDGLERPRVRSGSGTHAEPVRSLTPWTEPLVVLYEDAHLLAVAKPAGLLTQGTPEGEPTLEQAVRR